MYADGDPIGDLPSRVRALPGAVRVLVPGLGADAVATSDAPPATAGAGPVPLT